MANDNSGSCAGECSNTNAGLAKYSVCPSSLECGNKYVFIEELQVLDVQFTNANQVCVYTMLYSEFDPLDIIPDVNLNAWTLEGVQAELYSRVAKDIYSKQYLELDLTEEKLYHKNL